MPHRLIGCVPRPNTGRVRNQPVTAGADARRCESLWLARNLRIRQEVWTGERSSAPVRAK